MIEGRSRSGPTISGTGRLRAARADWRRRGSLFEVLEDRTLLSSTNNVSNL
jgi:hypothetical protein